MKIQKTKDYNKFSLLAANRDIIPSHVDTMVKSIKTMGIIRPMTVAKTDVISGKTQMYIVDGQHLEAACRRLEMSVPYTLISVTTEEDIIMKMGMLNNTSKSWNLGNYVDAYSTLKSKAATYQEIQRLRSDYNIEYSMLSALCTMNASWDSRRGTEALKHGELKITNKNVQKHCKDLKDIFDMFTDIEHSLKRKFGRSLIHANGNYDMDKVVKNIKKHKSSLILMGSEERSLDFIQEKIFELKLNKTK